MPTSRCPVVRPQAEPYGSRGFTTDYHDWHGEAGRCKFCGVSRTAARTTVEERPLRLGWQGLEVDRVRREFEQILVARQADGVPYSPDPNRWANVIQLMHGRSE